MPRCYDCEIKYHNIGRHKKAFETMLFGITVYEDICSKCGEKKMIVPTRDINRAVRASWTGETYV